MQCYDGIVMYGHASVGYTGFKDSDLLTGTSYDGLTAMEWRAFSPSQVEFIGPVPSAPIQESLNRPTDYRVIWDHGDAHFVLRTIGS